MSIASEISRLQTAKADLKTAIEAKGVTVPSSTKLDDYADLVDSIQAGGGGENMIKFIEIDLTGKGASSDNPYVIDVTDNDVIYCLSEFNGNRKFFRFNIEGTMSGILNVSGSKVLCWRHNGGSTLVKYNKEANPK